MATAMRSMPLLIAWPRKSSRKGTGRLSTQVKPVSSSKFRATDLPEPEVPVIRMIFCINGCTANIRSAIGGGPRQTAFGNGLRLACNKLLGCIYTTQIQNGAPDGGLDQHGQVTPGHYRQAHLPDGHPQNALILGFDGQALKALGLGTGQVHDESQGHFTTY